MTDEVDKYPQSSHSDLKACGKEDDRSSKLWPGLGLWMSEAKAANCSGDWTGWRRGRIFEYFRDG